MYLKKAQAENKTQILWLLRDSQQSTLADDQWAVSGTKLIELTDAAIEANIPAMEIGGGRFWEIAILNGQNPFRLIHKSKDEIDNLDKRDSKLQLQVLMRGPNGMGFDPVDPSVQEELIRQHAQAGIQVFRTFDALNDIRNINFFNFDADSNIHMQGALSYTTDGDLKTGEEPIYTIEYYLNYARKLVEKGFKSLCIKDMAGQLSADRARELITRLKQAFPNHPITLHIHSTYESQSLKTIETALACNIDGIELALPPLIRGTAHHDMMDFVDLQNVQTLNRDGLNKIIDYLHSYFANVTRIDTQIPQDVRERFCLAGVPGGAVPSVVKMLSTQFSKEYAEANHDEQIAFLDTYLQYVARVRRDAGKPPLVTPSADIVCRQAVFSYSSNRNCNDPESLAFEQMYLNITPDFANLVLGHFGFVYCYGNANDPDRISQPKDELINLSASRVFVGDKPFTNLWRVGGGRHASSISKKSLDDFLAEVDAFISRLADCIADTIGRRTAQHIAENLIYRFAKREHIALFLAMPPKGKGSDFIWWDLVLADFKRFGEKVSGKQLDSDENHELLETLYGRQCVPNAWHSKSSDLHALAAYVPTVYQRFNRRINEIEQSIDKCYREIREIQKKSWMQRPPIKRGYLHRLEQQKRTLQNQVDFCQNISTQTAIADNPEGRTFLHQFIYPIIWEHIKPSV